VLTILSAVAEQERGPNQERITEVKADQRKRHRHLGGSAPFGYRVEPEFDATGARKGGRLVEVPEQQAALRQIRTMRQEGKKPSRNSICHAVAWPQGQPRRRSARRSQRKDLTAGRPEAGYMPPPGGASRHQQHPDSSRQFNLMKDYPPRASAADRDAQTASLRILDDTVQIGAGRPASSNETSGSF